MHRSFMSRQDQKGASLILVAGSIFVLLGITAFTVDYGRYYVATHEMQNVADASALAGASDLGDFFAPNWETACDSAVEYFEKNKVLNLLANDLDATFDYGVWKQSSKTLSQVVSCANADNTDTPVYTAMDEFPVVRVTFQRLANSPSKDIPTVFARIFGINGIDAVVDAVAAIGVARPEGAGIPFVMGDACILQNIIVNNKPQIGYEFKLYSAQINKGASPNTSKNEFTCNDTEGLGQWTSFCNAAGCESAAKISDLISNPEKIPEINLNDTTALSEMKNGQVSSLYKDFSNEFDVGDKVLVPVISSSYLSNGEIPAVPLLNFVSLEIKEISAPGVSEGGGTDKVNNAGGANNNPYISFSVTESTKVIDSGPVTSGTRFNGVITKAFLVK